MSGSLDLREPADEVEGAGCQGEEVGEDCLSRLPIHLPLLERSPHSILWHKVGLEQRATNDTAIEQEIKMKLSFLQKIYKKRREGSWTGVAGLEVDMRTLELGLQDRCRQLEEAGRRMVEMRDAIAALQLEVGKAEKAKEELVRIGEDKRVMHQKSLLFIRNKMEEVQERTRRIGVVKTEAVDGCRLSSGCESVSPSSASRCGKEEEVPTQGCIQFGFGHILSLSGQLQELSQGEHGSKLLASRVQMASEAELGLLRQELGLPESLVDHLVNPHSVRVIVALAKVDPTSREALLRQTKDQLCAVLAIEGGHHFVQQLMEDAN